MRTDRSKAHRHFVIGMALISLGLSYPADMVAKRVSAAESAARAERYMASGEISLRNGDGTVANRGKKGGLGQLRLARTVRTEGGEDAVYLFNSGEGFVIAPADDRLEAVLGYSASGAYDEKAVPTDLKWWIGEYARQIEWLYNNGGYYAGEENDADTDSVYYPVVEPLLKSEWGQQAPFDALCPEINDERTVVGCVATSTAQVVRYHQWPQGPGEGTYRYTWAYKESGESKNKRLSFDFGATTFDWENMLDKYLGPGGFIQGTDEQKKAVAELSYAIGVGVQMSYNIADAGGSGAVSIRIPRALIDNLRYDEGVRYVQRDNYNYDWDKLIYDELAAGRPVILGGSGQLGGHSFVCDGYDGKGYFHINWGWYGSSDGYFRLNALNPPDLGVGGGSGGFNSYQDVVLGIQPPNDNATPRDPFVLSRGNLSIEAKTNRLVVANTDSQMGNYFLAMNWVPVTVVPTIRLVSEDGEERYLRSDYEYGFSALAENLSVEAYSQFLIPVDFATIEAGKYTMYPMVECDGGYFPIYFPPMSRSYQFLVKGEDGSVEVTNTGTPGGGTSGVKAVLTDDDSYDIYTIDGCLLRTGAGKSAVSEMPRGFYLLKGKNRTLKVKI